MGAGEAGLSPSQRIRLEELAACLVLGEGFTPEDAVRAAAALVGEGIHAEGLVRLACLPDDGKVLDGREVEVLFRTALAEVGLEPPSTEAAGWLMAGWIAGSMIERVISPADGAWRLGNLWRECGHSGELVEMLQLSDAWESSVGPDQAAVEFEMLAFAPNVIAAADRFLTTDG
jgi:hypothetical protein